MKKLKVLLVIVLVLIVVGFCFWYFYLKNNNVNDSKIIDIINKKYPEFSEYTQKVNLYDEKIKNDSGNVANYLSLGIQWKSIADRAKDEDKETYYNKARETYIKGVEISQRKNSILMYNVAKISEYLKDYQTAETYYREAISIDPGNQMLYTSLADLYRYYMGKTKEEVLSVYDEGIKKATINSSVQQARDIYLRSLE